MNAFDIAGVTIIWIVITSLLCCAVFWWCSEHGEDRDTPGGMFRASALALLVGAISLLGFVLFLGVVLF